MRRSTQSCDDQDTCGVPLAWIGRVREGGAYAYPTLKQVIASEGAHRRSGELHAPVLKACRGRDQEKERSCWAPIGVTQHHSSAPLGGREEVAIEINSGLVGRGQPYDVPFCGIRFRACADGQMAPFRT